MSTVGVVSGSQGRSTVDPLEVACAFCDASARQHCRTVTTGRNIEGYHKARIHAADALRAEGPRAVAQTTSRPRSERPGASTRAANTSPPNSGRTRHSDTAGGRRSWFLVATVASIALIWWVASINAGSPSQRPEPAATQAREDVASIASGGTLVGPSTGSPTPTSTRLVIWGSPPRDAILPRGHWRTEKACAARISAWAEDQCIPSFYSPRNYSGTEYLVWTSQTSSGVVMSGRSSTDIAGYALAEAWIQDGGHDYVFAECRDGVTQYPSRMAAQHTNAHSTDTLSGLVSLPSQIGSVCGTHRGLLRWRIHTSSPTTYIYGSVCRDGWLSSSTGQGTCSHHGGVDHVVRTSDGGFETSSLVK